MALIRPFHCFKDQLSAWCGKDVAVDLDIQHTLADITLLGRLMTGTAVGDDCDTIGIFQVFGDDHVTIDDDGV